MSTCLAREYGIFGVKWMTSHLFDVRNRLHSLSMSLLSPSMQAIDWIMYKCILNWNHQQCKKMNSKLTVLRASLSSLVLDVFSNAYKDIIIHVWERLEGDYRGTSLIRTPLGPSPAVQIIEVTSFQSIELGKGWSGVCVRCMCQLTLNLMLISISFWWLWMFKSVL